MRLSLHLVERADADHGEPAVRPIGVPLPEKLRVHAAVDDDDLPGHVLSALAQDHVPIELRDGDHERGLVDLLAQHVPVDVEVGPVGREAVGDSRQAPNYEARGGGMTREMAMHMRDTAGLHEAGGVHDLGEDAERSEEEVGAAPRSTQEVPERPQVRARFPVEEVELASEDRHGDERVKPGPLADRLRFGVDDLRPLSKKREHLHFDSVLLDGEDLAEDERLAQLREAGHDVGDLEPRRVVALRVGGGGSKVIELSRHVRQFPPPAVDPRVHRQSYQPAEGGAPTVQPARSGSALMQRVRVALPLTAYEGRATRAWSP